MISAWLDYWFGKPPVEKHYQLAVLGADGRVIRAKPFRIYRDLPEANEMQAKMIGRELAKDAMALTDWSDT